MALLKVRDADGNVVWMQASGAGTEADPFVVQHAFDLPTGAATAANQDAQTAKLTDIEIDTSGIATAAASIDGKTPALIGGESPVIDAITRTRLASILTALQSTLAVSVSNQPNPGARGDEFVGDIAANRATLGVDSVSVAIPHPDYPTTIDPQSTVPVGGTTADGFTVRLRTDKAGGQLLSDAPAPIIGEAWSLTTPLVISCDTTGYQSISVQVLGTFVATATFFASNDGANWVNVGGFAAFNSTAQVISASGPGLFSIPVVGRFFKLQLTAYTSGRLSAIAYLRSQPLPILTSTPSVSVSQVNGVGAVTAGVSGMLAIGGNVAPSAAPTAFPVPMGGWDGALTRRLLTNTSGALGVYGAAPLPIYVADSPARYAPDTTDQLLTAMLRELRVLNKLTSLGADYGDADDQLREDSTFWAN